MAFADLSAIAALSRGSAGEPPFLSPHHIEAARRVRLLFERAQLRSHVTMHYGPRIGSGGAKKSDVPEMAADARAALSKLLTRLPSECRGVVLDICCFEKGLQDVERERNWPRRSAKLVLRIGLDGVAEAHGLSGAAHGRDRVAPRTWMGEGAMPSEFG